MKNPKSTSPSEVEPRRIIVGDVDRPYSPPLRGYLVPPPEQPKDRAWLWLIVPLLIMVLVLWAILYVKWIGAH